MKNKVLLAVTFSMVLSSSTVVLGNDVFINEKDEVDLFVGDKEYLTGYEVDEVDSCIVPLRQVNDALGYETKWNNNKTIEVYSDTKKSNMKIGVDSYIFSVNNSNLLGTTAPSSLGYAPTIIDGITYVPVDFYNSFGGDDINVNFLETGYLTIDHNNSVEIPNPIVEYNSIDELNSSTEFEVIVPDIPNLELSNLSLISGDLVQLIYKNDDSSGSVTFRMSEGDYNNSGDYRELEEEAVIVDGVEVVVKGGDTPVVVIWTNEGYSYSLVADNYDLSDDLIKDIVKSTIE